MLLLCLLISGNVSGIAQNELSESSPETPKADATDVVQEKLATEISGAQYGAYEREGGRLWRRFRDGEITRDQYIERMKEFNDAKLQYEQDREKVIEKWEKKSNEGSEKERLEGYYAEIHQLREGYDGTIRSIMSKYEAQSLTVAAPSGGDISEAEESIPVEPSEL